MKNIKSINRRFLLTMATLIIYIGLSIGIIWYVYVYYINQSVTVALIVLLITLFVISVFRAKLDSLINVSYLIRIRENAGEPLTIQRLKTKEFLNTYLINNDYIKFAESDDHFLYYRTKKDHIKKMLRGYILEIVVYINQDEPEFYIESIDEEVQKLQEMFRKEKKKVEKLLITQLKFIDNLDENVKQQIREIVFMRSQSGIISTINVGLHLDSNKAVLLYSDTYSPSLYYKYHIELIKKLV